MRASLINTASKHTHTNIHSDTVHTNEHLANQVTVTVTSNDSQIY